MKKMLFKALAAEMILLSLTACNGGASLYMPQQQQNPAANNVIAGLYNGNVYQGYTLLGGTGPESTPVTVVAVNNGSVYAGTYGVESEVGGAVYQLVNGRWKQLGAQGVAMPDNNPVSSLAFNSNNNIFAGTYFSPSDSSGSVWQLSGGVWVQVNGSLFLLNPVTSVAFDSNNNLYAGTETIGGNVFESVAGSWALVNNASMPDISPVTSIVLDGYNNLFAATYAGPVYESTGGIWESVGAAPSLGSTNSLAVDSNNILYAGTSSSIGGAGGVYAYTPIGGIWGELTSGGVPDGSSVTSIAIDGSNNVYAGTTGGDVYEVQSGQWVLLMNFNSPVDSIAVIQ